MNPINVEDAPNAIGPYCHAMQVGNLLFCSGQTPLNPNTMEIEGTTIEEQTERVFNSIQPSIWAKSLLIPLSANMILPNESFHHNLL